MAEPFLSEIRICSFDFPPLGWALCNGQLLPINQYQPLFALLGTTFGGNGQTNFALPDLRGRTPIHFGASQVIGERAGTEAHTVSISEIPTHTHTFTATQSPGNLTNPNGGDKYLARTTTITYAQANNPAAMNAGAVVARGGSQPHTNMQPFLVLNFIIALQGIFPSQN